MGQDNAATLRRRGKRGEKPNVANSIFSPGRAAAHWNGRLRVESDSLPEPLDVTTRCNMADKRLIGLLFSGQLFSAGAKLKHSQRGLIMLSPQGMCPLMISRSIGMSSQGVRAHFKRDEPEPDYRVSVEYLGRSEIAVERNIHGKARTGSLPSSRCSRSTPETRFICWQAGYSGSCIMTNQRIHATRFAARPGEVPEPRQSLLGQYTFLQSPTPAEILYPSLPRCRGEPCNSIRSMRNT